MFDEAISDAALVDAISDSARAEAAAAARRLAAIAELTERRCASELAHEREYWACDGWDSAAAEVAAAQTISHRAASTLMHQGLALRDRLPKVGALLAGGAITAPLATLLCWRTHLVDDPAVLAAIDADLVAVITDWGRLSPAKLQTKVDALIDRHDPAAVLAYRCAARSRDVGVGKQDDDTGTSSLWGRLLGTDGELVKRRLEAMATAVCRQDPRTIGERRSDALGIVFAGGDVLPCRCEQPDCPSTGRDARADAVVIHVITNHHPDDTTGPGDPGPVDVDPNPAGTAANPVSVSPPCPPTAVIAGGPVVPAPLLAELARMGAVVRPVADPATMGAETGYRPSTLLARFVRARDLTCCFTGCDRPAEHCDLDHTVAYATSRLTHAGNVKCLCRKHHLLKTFWTGATGWHDRQEADGTIVWTSPTGHRYRTPPGSRLLFPHWNTSTPVPTPAPATVGPHTNRGLAMPLRKRTRTAQRANDVAVERARNIRVIEENPAPF